MIPTSQDHQPTDPEPYCSFCLRERTRDHDFYKQVADATPEMRSSMTTMLGYDFNLTSFAICRPCWRLMQLVQDFRLRCFKANALVGRIGRGLDVDDGWFSAKNLASIENVRIMVQRQVLQVEKVEVVESVVQERVQVKEEVELDGETLVSEITVEETKVEAVEEEDVPKHECGKCGKKLDTGHGLKLHLNYCNKSEVYKCDSCSITFAERKNYVTHMNRHQGVRPYECRKGCGKAFITYKTRHKHELTCVIDVQDCWLCQKQFTSKVRLHSHFKHDHQGERMYRCKICEKRFSTAESQKNHKATLHAKKRKKYECNVCNNNYTTLKLMKTHKRKFHQIAENKADLLSEAEDIDMTEETPPLDVLQAQKCERCQQVFDSKKAVTTHLNHCGVIKPKVVHSCHLCPTTFSAKHNLKTHLKKHDTAFKCTKHCEKGFFTAADRDEHELSCANDVQTCWMCSEQVSSKLKLLEHYRQAHPGEAMYRCRVCEKRFKTQAVRKIHEDQVCSNMEPTFPCKKCTKKFKTAWQARKHMERHANSKST